MLRCYCCDQMYERGKFRCCAAPSHMKSWRWRDKWCATCQKCPRHCSCVVLTPAEPVVALEREPSWARFRPESVMVDWKARASEPGEKI